MRLQFPLRRMSVRRLLCLQYPHGAEMQSELQLQASQHEERAEETPAGGS